LCQQGLGVNGQADKGVGGTHPNHHSSNGSVCGVQGQGQGSQSQQGTPTSCSTAEKDRFVCSCGTEAGGQQQQQQQQQQQCISSCGAASGGQQQQQQQQQSNGKATAGLPPQPTHTGQAHEHCIGDTQLPTQQAEPHLRIHLMSRADAYTPLLAAARRLGSSAGAHGEVHQEGMHEGTAQQQQHENQQPELYSSLSPDLSNPADSQRLWKRGEGGPSEQFLKVMYCIIIILGSMYLVMILLS